MGELPSRITLVKPEDRPINELLMESSLLVSDYSSVVWDFFKMKKPVIFFHFDSDEYLKQHGSFIDFNAELIGPRASDVVAAVEEIGSALKNQFALPPKYLTAYERSFPLDDHKNCERIYAVTEQLQKESGHEFLKFLVSVLGLPKLKLKKRFSKLFSRGGS
jgi:CDP-glycerol glycerophosphotransferase (TagB/SpsB family)